MRGSSARRSRWVLLPILTLLLISSSAAAQLPEIETSDEHYAANIVPAQGSASIPYLGTATIPVTIDDISQDPGGDQGAPREVNRITLSVDVRGNDTRGWVASLSQLQLPTRAGETHEVQLNLQVGATVRNPTVHVRIQSVYHAPDGTETLRNASVLAVAESFPRLTMQMGELPDSFQPNEFQSVPLTVTNSNYYPDMVSFRASQPEGWLVSPPSSIRLAPGETKTVFVDVKAPENPWFRYTTQSDLFSVEAVSETSGQPLVSVGVPVTQSGSTFPAWAGPHLLLLLIGAATIVTRSRKKRRDRRLEKGKPSYPGLDPEHEAELEGMKIAEPDEAEVVEDRLETLYEHRKQAWKEAYEQRQEIEETLQEAYEERHDVLVEARESDGIPDAEKMRRRRELLESKRELLRRKREALRGSSEGSSSEDASSDG